MTGLLKFEELPDWMVSMGRRRVMYLSTKGRFPSYWRASRNSEPLWSACEIDYFSRTRVPSLDDLPLLMLEGINRALSEEFDGEPLVHR